MTNAGVTALNSTNLGLCSGCENLKTEFRRARLQALLTFTWSELHGHPQVADEQMQVAALQLKRAFLKFEDHWHETHHDY